MLKVLIVDDEAPARRELRAQLSGMSGVQVVGEAADCREAQELIDAIDYDAVFLDVQMPGLSGIDLARRLQDRERRPKVVFTTAHAQYAVDAFGIGAADYLLKPFDEERLARALSRLQLNGAQPGAPQQPVIDRLPAEQGNKTVLVQINEIIYAFARREEVFFRRYRDELLCRRFTLRELETKLGPHGFLRVHRGYLVNLNKVRAIGALHKAGMSVVVEDSTGSEIPVSRSLMPDIKQRFGLARTE